MLLVLGLLPAGASGAVEPATGTFEAVRTTEPPHIDGRLDDAGWLEAPVFSAFHQSFPEPGQAPSERTEVRVLYDDASLYVGIRCFDRQADALNARLGLRDELPASDAVHVMIDSLRDRRTGSRFSLNAGGTLADARLFEDTQEDGSWDAIWEGAAARDAQGWSAELRIPLELLHFPREEEQRWGFHVRREIARTHEQLDSVPLPLEVNALVSRFTELRNLRDLAPPASLTLTPYVATRLTRRPGPGAGRPRLFEPSADVGLDLRAGLSSDLTLSVALNPEFGQVEADELVTNLTTSELEFSEKRPFFQQGLELFEPVGEVSGLPRQALFYSRRLGLEAGLPLLAAVKLGGSVREGVQVGVLDAVVAGAEDPGRREAIERGEDPDALPPDRSIRFHPWRPLHFAPNSSLPARVPPPINYFAGVTRLEVASGATLGATATLATPLSSGCEWELPESLGVEWRPRCGRAVAVDTSLRSDSGAYTLAAQVAGSQVTGGPEGGVVLLDGTPLRGGDTGLGFQLSGGKLGGEPWRLSVAYSHASPQLELNPTGFQPLQNEQVLQLSPQYVHTGWASAPEASLGLQATQRWSTDSRSVSLGTRLELLAGLLLANSSNGSCNTGVELGRKDLREIWQAGVAFERPSFAFFSCFLSSDPNRQLSASAVAYVDRLLGANPSGGRIGQSFSLDVTWRPLPSLQTSLGASYQSSAEGPRWVGVEEEEGAFLFGDLTPRFLTLTLRQVVAISPSLTFEAFAQSLSGFQRYGRFSSASAAPGDSLRLVGLRPIELPPAADPSSSLAQLTVNAVVRWEYRLGSTLYFVYARSQQAQQLAEGDASRLTLLPRGLLAGPHTDVVLLKLGYAW